jgi:hypothetical protein
MPAAGVLLQSTTALIQGIPAATFDVLNHNQMCIAALSSNSKSYAAKSGNTMLCCGALTISYRSTSNPGTLFPKDKRAV